MSKLFSYDYLNTNYSVVKHRRNISFQEIGTESLTEKNNGFWSLWGIFKKYVKRNIIMAVLRKANSHSQ